VITPSSFFAVSTPASSMLPLAAPAPSLAVNASTSFGTRVASSAQATVRSAFLSLAAATALSICAASTCALFRESV
jgi:hypothetical protein